jgi:hypothetical protein
MQPLSGTIQAHHITTPHATQHPNGRVAYPYPYVCTLMRCITNKTHAHKTHAHEMYVHEMYVYRYTPVKHTPMRHTPMTYTPIKCMPKRCIPMNRMSLIRIPMRYTPIRCTLIRYVPVRHMPMRYAPEMRDAEQVIIWVKWAPNLASFAAAFLLPSHPRQKGSNSESLEGGQIWPTFELAGEPVLDSPSPHLSRAGLSRGLSTVR